jgi:hypothetical protein
MQRRLLAVNAFSSLILQITILIYGFILSRAILMEYGSETNWFGNSILRYFQKENNNSFRTKIS